MAFDPTTTEAVEKFSKDLENLINTSDVTANIQYVILHFYANQMMSQISAQAISRTLAREEVTNPKQPYKEQQ